MNAKMYGSVVLASIYLAPLHASGGPALYLTVVDDGVYRGNVETGLLMESPARHALHIREDVLSSIDESGAVDNWVTLQVLDGDELVHELLFHVDNATGTWEPKCPATRIFSVRSWSRKNEVYTSQLFLARHDSETEEILSAALDFGDTAAPTLGIKGFFAGDRISADARGFEKVTVIEDGVTNSIAVLVGSDEELVAVRFATDALLAGFEPKDNNPTTELGSGSDTSENEVRVCGCSCIFGSGTHRGNSEETGGRGFRRTRPRRSWGALCACDNGQIAFFIMCF